MLLPIINGYNIIQILYLEIKNNVILTIEAFVY